MKIGDNRKILHESEVEKMLILLLAHENPDVQVAASQALAVMSENLLSRDSVGQWGKGYPDCVNVYCVNIYHNV